MNQFQPQFRNRQRFSFWAVAYLDWQYGVSGHTFTATVTEGSPDTFGITIKKSDGSTYYSAAPGLVSGGDFVISVL